MDPMESYREALAFFREREYGKALEAIGRIRELVLRWPRLDLLEAYVYREQGRYVSEICLLRGCLDGLDLEDSGERELAAEAWSLLGSAYYMLGAAVEAVAAFRESSRLEQSPAKKRVECSNALFSATAVPDFSPEDFRHLYGEYRSLLEAMVPYPLKFYRHGRLRVGYLSADFREHPLADWLWPLLRYHDRQAFRLYCYASNACDWVTGKMRGEVEEWRDISACTDEEVAALVRQDEIDLLFDLSGHTSGNRLGVMAYHPAAVQISGLGHMGSTGMDRIEYFWADRNCYGPSGAARDYFVETVLHSLGCLICYSPLRSMPDPAVAPCVERGSITFGCFNNFSKVTDEVFALWAELLARVPGSRLVLKHRLFGSDEGVEYTLDRLHRAGLEASRVELRGFSKDYLREYADIDIALDTYPYVGGVTTCEALYMGVPVIVFYGQRPGSRLGYTILNNIGLEELAASSGREYVDKAAALAGDRELVAALHRNLRGMMQQSPLMDAEGYVKDAEALYQKLWVRAWISKGLGG